MLRTANKIFARLEFDKGVGTSRHYMHIQFESKVLKYSQSGSLMFYSFQLFSILFTIVQDAELASEIYCNDLHKM
jgi:hypothetical protein